MPGDRPAAAATATARWVVSTASGNSCSIASRMPQLRSTSASSRLASLTDSTEASASTMLATASSPSPSAEIPTEVWKLAADSADTRGSSGRTRSSSIRAPGRSSALVRQTASAMPSSRSSSGVRSGSARSSATAARRSSTRLSRASARAAATRSGRRSRRA